MALKWADNVVEESATTTTGAYQLGGVPSTGIGPGAQGFVAGIGDTNTCYYYAYEVGGTAWERGIGTVTDAATDTLTRTTIYGSSNAGSAVDWTGKTVRIRVIEPARTLYSDHAYMVENLTIAHSRSGNAETIALKTLAGTDPTPDNPIRIGFNTTTGGFTVLEITAATSIVLSSGSTLGATSGGIFRVWLVGFNDSGTFRLGAIKCALTDGVYGLQDNVVESSTAEGGTGTADSSGVIYTGTAVTSKVMRVLGYLEYTLTTAGTWDAAPSLVLLYGRGTKLPGDTVQIKRTVDATARSVTSASFQASGVSVDITPKSACNGVRLQVMAGVGRSQEGAVYTTFYRGTMSLIPSGAAGMGSTTLNANTYEQMTSIVHTDFPLAASSTTYNIYMHSGNAAHTAYLARRGDSATVTNATVLEAEEIMV